MYRVKAKQIGSKIRNLRKKYKLSQNGLARKMNLSRSALSQIENGKRKVTAAELAKFAQFFNIDVNKLINRPKLHTYFEDSKTILRESAINYNRSIYRFNKFREILLYILNKVGAKSNIVETVIYKILYFIDFDYYERFNQKLIGATYIKKENGPAPLEFESEITNMVKDDDLEIVKSDYFVYPETKYLPHRKAKLEQLTGREIYVINSVLEKLSDKNVTEITRYVLEDLPCKIAAANEIIDYEKVFERKQPYSVRIIEKK